MTESLKEKLHRHGCLILDGGFATTLEENGYTLDSKLWSAEKIINDQQAIEMVHQQYLEAGCDILTTSSYQMSYEGFNELGYNDIQCENFFVNSTRCAINVREKYASNSLIATSIGCYGAHLADGSEYRGMYGLSISELMNWHRRKLYLLSRSGAELVACETIPCIAEGHALHNLLVNELFVEETSSASVNQGWLSFACRSGRELNSGEPFEDMVRAITDNETASQKNSLGIGINCTNPGYVIDLLDVLRDTGAMSGYRPIVVYPNKGEIWNASERNWEENSGYTDELFGNLAVDWRNSGANIIGGCCRTTPNTIRQIRASLKLS